MSQCEHGTDISRPCAQCAARTAAHLPPLPKWRGPKCPHATTELAAEACEICSPHAPRQTFDPFTREPSIPGLRRFTEAYIECALWAESCEEEPYPDRSLTDAGYTADDIALETRRAMHAECRAFFLENRAHIGDEETRAGHDFWLTRNGHGAGFWDGDWSEPAATELTEASEKAGERNLYVGDDGRIWSMQ